MGKNAKATNNIIERLEKDGKYKITPLEYDSLDKKEQAYYFNTTSDGKNYYKLRSSMIAIGDEANVESFDSIAIGHIAKSLKHNSIAIGYGTQAKTHSSIAIRSNTRTINMVYDGLEKNKIISKGDYNKLQDYQKIYYIPIESGTKYQLDSPSIIAIGDNITTGGFQSISIGKSITGSNDDKLIVLVVEV